jgi:signal transduction histidine kinase
MFANISHDLRTPLTIIQGCLETAQTKGESLPTPRRSALMDAALTQCLSLGRLVETVFELSKLQSTDYQLRREVFSIADLLQDVAMKFSLKAMERGISIRIDGGDRHINVTADVLLVERVLDNLIGNALRHAEGANEITIRLVEWAMDVEIMVCDNGSGISAAAWDRILTEQAGKPPSYPGATENGFGLGLSIVRRILELHDTSLGLVTTGANGTTFRFALTKADCFGGSKQPPGRRYGVTACRPLTG